MKLIKIINPKNLSLSPKRLFRSKKDPSTFSRSDPSSFSSGATSSSSSEASVFNHKPDARGASAGFVTPTSVLPQNFGDGSAISADIYYELAQAFKLIDRDNDGVVPTSELEALLSRLGAQPPSPEEVAAMLAEVDRYCNGYISFDALMSRIGSEAEPAGDDELREAFEFFDTDHDGKITAEELLGVFTGMGDERCTIDDCSRMIAEVGKNGDGFVCYEDFSRMMEMQR